MATTLTQKIDAKIEAAIEAGEEPDYKKIAEEVLESGLDRKSRQEAVGLGVTLRARYRLRARGQKHQPRRGARSRA